MDTPADLPFTGERVIPGAVDLDLWHEHISRYHLARSFCDGKKALDVGCGVAYGTGLLAKAAAQTFGFDLSLDAVGRGVEVFAQKAHLLVGSAEAFPFPSNSMDVITCFEVIEHLVAWDLLLEEAARVLSSDGIFIVSTPNKSYYSNTRSEVGPNPFHVHEFELTEFQSALRAHFRYVRMLAQNQQEAMIFAEEQSEQDLATGFIASGPELSEAQFFLAICSEVPVKQTAFAYFAQSGNLLRDREYHIRVLQAEAADSRAQLEQARARLTDLHSELASRTTWAGFLRTKRERSALWNQAMQHPLLNRGRRFWKGIAALKTRNF